MAVPAVPAAGLVVIEPELGLGGLEGVLDRPAPTLDADQHLERQAGLRWRELLRTSNGGIPVRVVAARVPNASAPGAPPDDARAEP